MILIKKIIYLFGFFLFGSIQTNSIPGQVHDDCIFSRNNEESSVVCENPSGKKEFPMPIFKKNVSPIPKLNILQLDGYPVTELPDKIFDDFTIDKLILRNHLTTIRKNNFNKISGLNTLHLDNNPLKTIETGSFQAFTETLKFLSMCYCELSDSDFANFFKEIETLNSLEVLYIAFNNLETFDYQLNIKTLRGINLSRNKLKIIDKNSFSNLNELYSLDISYNKLERFDPDIFSMTTNLIYVYLDNNYLSELPKFDDTQKLIILNLTNQNGMLNEIKDYAFDRNSKYYNLSIYLNENILTNVQKHAFESKQADMNAKIEIIELSESNTLTLDKCILNSLKKNRISLKLSETNELINCNCKFFAYAKHIGYKLIRTSCQLERCDEYKGERCENEIEVDESKFEEKDDNKHEENDDNKPEENFPFDDKPHLDEPEENFPLDDTPHLDEPDENKPHLDVDNRNKNKEKNDADKEFESVENDVTEYDEFLVAVMNMTSTTKLPL